MSPPVDKYAANSRKRDKPLLGSENSFDRCLTHEFIKRGCFLSGCLTSVGKGKNAHRGDLVTPGEGDFVAGFHSVRRLGNAAIDGSPASITKTLRKSTSGTKATCFEEEIEAHDFSFKFQVSSFKGTGT